MPLGADTETRSCVDKLQHTSCLDTKSHEESFRTSVVMINKSGELGMTPCFFNFLVANCCFLGVVFRIKSNCVPLGAHTETTFWGDKLQYDSCLDTKSHEESSCTSVVMKNKSKGRGKIRPPTKMYTFG